MSLPVPGVGIENGPQYAIDLNNCLAILDQHNHAAGSGVQITPNGLNINSDLTIGSNNLTNIRSSRYQSQTSPLALASDLQSVYVSGKDLYYNDSTGAQIRITQNGAVAGTPGSIANLASPASAAYVSGSSTFVFQSAAVTPANLDGASITLRNLSASSFGLTLAPPNSMGSNTTITLPSLPASPALLSIDTSGNISASAPNTQALNPTGAVIMFVGTTAPSGYLMCDGSAVSRTTYSNLFGVISTAYGVGDGTTTFNLPDARGNFFRGVNAGSGRDPDASSRTATNGGNAGDSVGSSQGSQYASHSHTFSFSTPGAVLAQATGTTIQQITSTPTLNTGGSGGSETRPVNLYINFIVKT